MALRFLLGVPGALAQTTITVDTLDDNQSLNGESGGSLATGVRGLPGISNPFPTQAQFSVAVPTPQHVSVRVYDVLGRKVARLHDEMLTANHVHTFHFDAHGRASGLYIYEIVGEYFRTNGTLTLTR